LDTLTAAARAGDMLYTSEAACLVAPGWGVEAGADAPTECGIGTFNEGKNHGPCHHCGLV
jgi:hypothetical protein